MICFLFYTFPLIQAVGDLGQVPDIPRPKEAAACGHSVVTESSDPGPRLGGEIGFQGVPSLFCVLPLLWDSNAFRMPSGSRHWGQQRGGGGIAAVL